MALAIILFVGGWGLLLVIADQMTVPDAPLAPGYFENDSYDDEAIQMGGMGGPEGEDAADYYPDEVASGGMDAADCPDEVASGEAMDAGDCPGEAASGVGGPAADPGGGAGFPGGDSGGGEGFPGGDPRGEAGFPGGDPGGGAGFPGGDPGGGAGFPDDDPGGGAGFPGGDPAAAGFGDGAGMATNPEPPMMAEIGKSYLGQGRFQDGMKFIHAAVLLGDEGGEELMAQYRWVTGLNRPTLTIRWGIAIQVTQPEDFKGKYYPIGEDQKLDGSLANPGNNNNEVIPGGGNQELTEVVGDLGDYVVGRIMARTERNYYGELFSITAKRGRRGGGGAGMPDDDPGGGAGFPDDDPGGGEGFPGGGAGFPGGDPGGGAGFPGGGGSGRSARSGSASLTMLGKGGVKELLPKAKAQGLDVVLYFKIRVVKSMRTGLVTNLAEIDVIDVATGEKVFSLPELKNTTMQKARAVATLEGLDDPLEVAIDGLFQFTDRQYRMLPVPQKTTSEILNLRTSLRSVLSGEKPENPLAALAEIKFLYSKEMVRKEHLQIAFEQLLGQELSEKWFQADNKGRAEILSLWLPKTANAPVDPGGGAAFPDPEGGPADAGGEPGGPGGGTD